jgi:CRP/FNR family transcriptional regulator, cyclic AMP receptor protein
MLELLGYVGAKWPELVGYLAAICTLFVYSMKTMVPLRVAGITANFLFISYGYFEPAYPTLVLHSILLPLNSFRLYEMLQLTKKIAAAARSDLSMDWLKTVHVEAKVQDWGCLISQGRCRKRALLPANGKIRARRGWDCNCSRRHCRRDCFRGPRWAPHANLPMSRGWGLADDRLSADQAALFPKSRFGFYLLQLISGRLFKDIEKLETALAKATASTLARGAG